MTEYTYQICCGVCRVVLQELHGTVIVFPIAELPTCQTCQIAGSYLFRCRGGQIDVTSTALSIAGKGYLYETGWAEIATPGYKPENW